LKDPCFLKISPLPSLPKRGTKNYPQKTLKSRNFPLDTARAFRYVDFN
jgi:hypothetical protein